MTEEKKTKEKKKVNYDYFGGKHNVAELELACTHYRDAFPGLAKASEEQLRSLRKAFRAHKNRVLLNRGRKGMGGMDATKLSRIVDFIEEIEMELAEQKLTYTDSPEVPHTLAKMFLWCDTWNTEARFKARWEDKVLDSRLSLDQFIAEAKQVFAYVMHRYGCYGFMWKTLEGLRIEKAETKDICDFRIRMTHEREKEVSMTWYQFWEAHKDRLPRYDHIVCEYGDPTGQKLTQVDGSLKVFNIYVPEWVREV